MTASAPPAALLPRRPTATHVQFRCPDDVLKGVDELRYPLSLNRSEIIVKALRTFLSLPAPVDRLQGEKS